ncbi:hypothetical protein L9F63_022834, partial [Diploptera punctata]
QRKLPLRTPSACTHTSDSENGVKITKYELFRNWKESRQINEAFTKKNYQWLHTDINLQILIISIKEKRGRPIKRSMKVQRERRQGLLQQRDGLFKHSNESFYKCRKCIGHAFFHMCGDVLRACPFGESLRNIRHHTIRNMLTEALRDYRYTVYEEVQYMKQPVYGSERHFRTRHLLHEREARISLVIFAP